MGILAALALSIVSLPGAAGLLAQSARVVLTAPLERWKQEIERRAGGRLVVARIYLDRTENALLVPEDVSHRSELQNFFLQQDFRNQFVRTHGMLVSTQGLDGPVYFVLLNMDLAEQWEGAEQAILAHEFGHAWLNALGYESPAYEPGPRSCIAVHAADVVQHVLIRDEIRRRNIAYVDYWKRNLAGAIAEMDRQASQPRPAPEPCQRLAQLALWTDVRLGLAGQRWPQLSGFEQRMRRNFPELLAYTGHIEQRLRGLNLRDQRVYRFALEYTLEKFGAVYELPGR